MVDVVEDGLVQYIIENGCHLGDSIPGENDLAQMMGVGRNVVREALSRLKSRGVLTSRKHRGIEVSEPKINKCFEKSIIPQLLSKSALLDLLELRYMLEIGCVPTLFSNITDDDIVDLERILKQQIIIDGKISTESEQDFHSRIYKISKNQLLIDLQKMLIPIFRYIHENFEDYNKFNIEIKRLGLQAKHEDLLKCIKAHDAKAYTEMLSRHLMPYKLYIEEYRSRASE